MGLFTDNKQAELDKSALTVYNAMDQFTIFLDANWGINTFQGRVFADQFEEALISLYNLAVKYEKTHAYVVWSGQKMKTTQLIPMIIMVLEDEIEAKTTYRFTRINGLLR